jgi:DNA-binding HxlR family transcriptional regulator
MRKQASTNTINKQQLEKNCGMAYTISVISGRWKLSVLGFLLNEGTHRYNEIRRKLPGISERMLVAQLRELEKDGLITRVAYPEVPPRVEYALSEKGRSLGEILDRMSEWGEEHVV